MKTSKPFFLSRSPLFYSLFLSLFLTVTSSQMICAQCIEGAPNCANATSFCGQSLAFRLPDFINNTGPIPSCGGAFSFHNTSWFVLTVETSIIELVITSSNCEFGLGIQAGLYLDCDPNSPSYGVQCACTDQPISLGGSVTPGQTLYLMIDGCSGDHCDINVAVVRGAIAACSFPSSPPLAPISSSDPICPGETVTFFTDFSRNVAFYEWDFPAGVTVLDTDCDEATVIWGDNSGPVSVTAYDGSGNGVTSDPTFVNVFIPQGQDSGSYCFPDEPGYLYTDGNYYPSGIYDVVLSGASASGCDSVVTLEVTEFQSPPNLLSYELCNGDSLELNGEIYLNTGTYLQTLPNASLYGCDSLLVITIEALNFTPTFSLIKDASCGLCNGAIELSIDCAQLPLAIEWTGGIPNDATSATGLCPGTYGVTVTDAGGMATSLTVVLEALPGLTVEAVVEPVSCFGADDGAVAITVSGGVGPFDYDWSDDALDGQGAVMDLAGGAYELTVTDSDACDGMISLVVPEPAPLAITLELENIDCAQLGMATAMVTGGTSPYTYNWTTGQNGNSIDDLEIGGYGIIVEDANRCEVVTDFTIETPFLLDGVAVNTFESGLPDQDTLFCGQLTDTLRVNHYQGASYAWMTLDGNILENQDTFIIVNTAGTYFVQMRVEDLEGTECVLRDSIQMIRECCPIDFMIQTRNETCRGIDDGRARVIINSGGVPPFSYQWSDPNLPAEAEVSDLPVGDYSLTLTDATGCTYVETFTINAYLDLIVTSTPADCDGAGGTATASATGFFISYNWSNGGTGNTQTGLDAGEYTVTAWSIFGGCQSQVTFTIEIDSSCNDAAFTDAAELQIEEEDLSFQLPGANIQFDAAVHSSTDLVLFPNPVTQVGYAKVQLSVASQINLSLYDRWGKVLKTLTEKLPAGTHQFEWDMSPFSNGIYYVILETSSGLKEHGKWVKIQ